MRVILLAVAVALFAAAAPQPAGANQDPQEIGTNQAEACRLMGGTPEVIETRTSKGLLSVLVKCRINGVGIWMCFTDWENIKTCDLMTNSVTSSPSRWVAGLSGEILPALATGSAPQIETAVLAFNANLAASGEVIGSSRASRDQSVSTDTGDSGKDGKYGKKGKHGKHGKHRGKGHRK